MPGPTHVDPILYEHLRALAHRIHGEGGSSPASLAPTALLHEAWVKLARSDGEYTDRRHFVAVAARAMRQILVDRARARRSLKRGNDARQVTLADLGAQPCTVDVLVVDAAIERLAAEDPVAADVFVLRCFGGLTVPECAEVLERSPRSIDMKWRFARSFLATELDMIEGTDGSAPASRARSADSPT